MSTGLAGTKLKEAEADLGAHLAGDLAGDREEDLGGPNCHRLADSLWEAVRKELGPGR